MNPPNEYRPGLRPPQFSLRAMLLFMAALGILFSLVNVLPPLVVAGVVFFALAVAAHVVGNAIGTRLRANGDRPVDRVGLPIDYQTSDPAGVRPRCAPRTELSRRASLGWAILVATSAGAVLGGIGGGVFAIFISRPQVEPLAIGLGVIAFGVFGGFAAFMAFSFAQVGLSALWQAQQSSRPSPRE